MKEIIITKKVTYLSISLEVGCSEGTIYTMVNGKTKITKERLDGFKVAAGIVGVPLDDDNEVSKYKEDLFLQREFIKFDEKGKVVEIIDKLMLCSNWCYNSGLSLLCDIFVATYYFAISENSDGEKSLNQLKLKEANFNNEHWYWYFQLHGWLKVESYYFKDALVFYLDAEKLESKLEFKRDYLPYSIGFCYSELPCPVYAIEYFEKVIDKGISVIGAKCYLFTQRFLAINYSKINHKEKALGLLVIHSRYFIMNSINDTENKLAFLCAQGIVYRNLGEYDKSEEFFDELFIESMDKSLIMHVTCCYQKTLLYIETKDFKKSEEFAKRGLDLYKSHPFWFLIFDTICRFLSIKSKEDAMYLEWTAIKKLNEYGKYDVVIHCYNFLADYYASERFHRVAWEFSKKASKLYAQLIKGEVFS